MTGPHLCPVQTCTHGKNGARYTGSNEKALALHVQKRHPEELQPLPAAPTYTPILGVKRAAVYLRVSTIDQHPENQLPNIKMFCAMKGWEIIEIYEDKASGKDMNRPELQRLMADSVAGPRAPWDVVVFRRLSRLGRSLKDNIFLFDHFQRLGVALCSTEEAYDTTTPSGRFTRNVLASVHEYVRENMIEEVKEGMARRAAEGKPLGRHRIGCGIPKELGGWGPCPDGIHHKVNAADLIAMAEKRAKDRDRKARAKLEKAVRNRAPLSGGESVLASGG